MIYQLHYKISKLLEDPSPFKSEKDVVYFLVEVRKLIESKVQKQVFPIIQFYCDWILHPQKNYHLDVIEPFINNLSEESYSGYSDLFLMKGFNQELNAFLSLNILRRFTEEELIWAQFFYYLTEVLSEQPIIFSEHRIKVKSIKYLSNNIRGFEISFRTGNIIHYNIDSYFNVLTHNNINLNPTIPRLEY